MHQKIMTVDNLAARGMQHNNACPLCHQATEDTQHLVVGLNPPMGVDRQHESREARSLYPSALQLTRALKLEFVGRAT
jgi:hypothetical protein